jgi:hypothetical protein
VPIKLEGLIIDRSAEVSQQKRIKDANPSRASCRVLSTWYADTAIDQAWPGLDGGNVRSQKNSVLGIVCISGKMGC